MVKLVSSNIKHFTNIQTNSVVVLDCWAITIWKAMSQLKSSLNHSRNVSSLLLSWLKEEKCFLSSQRQYDVNLFNTSPFVLSQTCGEWRQVSWAWRWPSSCSVGSLACSAAAGTEASCSMWLASSSSWEVSLTQIIAVSQFRGRRPSKGAVYGGVAYNEHEGQTGRCK